MSPSSYLGNHFPVNVTGVQHHYYVAVDWLHTSAPTEIEVICASYYNTTTIYHIISWILRCFSIFGINVTLYYRMPVTYAKDVLILPRIVWNSVLFLLCTRCLLFDAINLKGKRFFPVVISFSVYYMTICGYVEPLDRTGTLYCVSLYHSRGAWTHDLLSTRSIVYLFKYL